MIRKYLPVDWILKNIKNNNNAINRILLNLNHFPKILYGKKYLEHKEKVGQSFNTEEKLIQVVNRVIKTTPYYRARYKPIQSLQEFKSSIGFIDKDVVLSNFEDFIANSINKQQYIEGTTGGTSGKPMHFLIPKNRYKFELATIHSFWNRVGWDYHLRAVIRNHKLHSDTVYKINPLTKEIIFDAFRIDENYVQTIYKVLKKFGIQYIHAYPSAAFQFSRICKNNNLDISFIKAFLTASEAVFEFQQNFIEEEIGIKIYNHYGHSEKLILGGYCEYSTNIHFEPSYGFAELIDNNGKTITERGQVGELVGTTFHNLGMPLIRYKTGDYAEFVGYKCDDCGRKGLIVKNVQSHRGKNIIYKKNGTYTTSTALNLHGKLNKHIDGLQYLQKEPGKLTVRILKNNQFEKKDQKLLYAHFKEAMGKNSNVTMEYVDDLENLPNGKFPLLISEVEKQNTI